LIRSWNAHSAPTSDPSSVVAGSYFQAGEHAEWVDSHEVEDQEINVGRGALIATVGVAAGTAAAAVLARTLTSTLNDLKPTDLPSSRSTVRLS